jgi:hypothetical protein
VEIVKKEINSGKKNDGITEIIEPQKGFCKNFDAIPLRVKAYKTTEMSGAQKMRERQLRQLLLESNNLSFFFDYFSLALAALFKICLSPNPSFIIQCSK